MIELKTLRKSTHLTQSEFADVLRVPVSTYSKWEQGINKPADSQVFLMCYFLYNNGYIKTYLNDPNLSLTEMGLIMSWVREDSVNRFIENGKSDICLSFANVVTKEEADKVYKKLNKHYILSRKLPKVNNYEQALSKEESEKAAYRILDGKGVEILPFDAGTIRGTFFEGDSYFFFERLAETLNMKKNGIWYTLLDECHDDYYRDYDISIKAKAVMNCLYYKYYLKFPLCFNVGDLIKYYSEDFYICIDELIEKGYITKLNSGYYEFNTEHNSYKYGARFYLNGKLFIHK